MKIIERMNSAALEVLPAVPDRNKRRSFRPRQMGRAYQRLRRERAWLIRKQSDLSAPDADQTPSCRQAVSSPGTPFQGMPEPDGQKAYRARYQEAGREMKILHIKHSKQARLAQIKKMHKLLHTNRKKGHKLIFDQDCPVKKLESVLDTNEQKVYSDGPAVRRVVQAYFTELMKEPHTAADPSTTPPWENRGQKQLDPFKLHQSGNVCCQDELNMLQQMDDLETFATCLGTWLRIKLQGPTAFLMRFCKACLPC